jgi:Right handed beta helix region
VLKRIALSSSVACVLAAAVALPASAGAASLYVSNKAPAVSGGKSCTQPAYKSIQTALGAPGAATIDVCPGTYAEQLTITKAVKLNVVGTSGSAKVVLPASPADTKTECDQANGTEAFQPDQDGISICTSGAVSITGLAFEPKWAEGVCDESLYGILVAGGATLKAKDVTIDGGGAFPLNGCQGGIGIQVGMAWTTPVEVGHATLSGVTIADYQKNGITVDGAGSSASISATTVTGAGTTPVIAQNGIQVSNGAQAKIKSSKVAANECDAPSCGPVGLTQTQSTGLLFYGAAPGTSVTSTELAGDDVGAYYDSTAAKPPSSPELTLSKDVFAGNRYEGVVLEQGDALIKGGSIVGPGDIGVDLLQYESQTLPSSSSASGLKIEGQSDAGVKVESDHGAKDTPGRFVLSKSTLSGNGAALENESSTFEVVL